MGILLLISSVNAETYELCKLPIIRNDTNITTQDTDDDGEIDKINVITDNKVEIVPIE